MLKGKWIVRKEQSDVARLVFVLFCSNSLFKVFRQMFIGFFFLIPQDWFQKIIVCRIKAVAVSAKIRGAVMCGTEMGDG